jgi:hypothetical protein
MFLVIYRWRLRTGFEEQFAEAWRTITDLAIHHCGSGGSCLSQDSDGTWVAIARWESGRRALDALRATLSQPRCGGKWKKRLRKRCRRWN